MVNHNLQWDVQSTFDVDLIANYGDIVGFFV